MDIYINKQPLLLGNLKQSLGFLGIFLIFSSGCRHYINSGTLMQNNGVYRSVNNDLLAIDCGANEP